MQETRWLESDDPREMLNFLTRRNAAPVGQAVVPESPPSDRKLRLFACACAYAFHPAALEHYREVEESGGDRDAFAANLLSPASLAGVWVSPNFASGNPLLPERPPADRGRVAALLREIVGNPFRPVVLPKVHYGTTRPDGRVVVRSSVCPWITPQVLLLAAAAYENRPGRECGRCKGRKWIARRVSDDGVGRSTATEECPDCQGTGRISDGSLDPVRLVVLADALEEAGCSLDVPCPDAHPEGYCAGGEVGMMRNKCWRCDGKGRLPNPLLSHLRSPGPHYRGCWAVDCILGKE